MSSPRQNANERRLAQLRVLKEEHFADELTDEEIIEAKNARIELLEDEVAKLRKRVNQLEGRSRVEKERIAKVKATKSQRTLPETAPAEEPKFDFYQS